MGMAAISYGAMRRKETSENCRCRHETIQVGKIGLPVDIQYGRRPSGSGIECSTVLAPVQLRSVSRANDLTAHGSSTILDVHRQPDFPDLNSFMSAQRLAEYNFYHHGE